MVFKVKSLKPGQDGARLVMGELEACIMDFMWTNDHSSVKHVHAHLSDSRKIAYTTVMTVMLRLTEKELLSREKQGRCYYYRPLLTRTEFEALCTKSMIHCLETMEHDRFISLYFEYLGRIGAADSAVVKKLHDISANRLKEISKQKS